MMRLFQVVLGVIVLGIGPKAFSEERAEQPPGVVQGGAPGESSARPETREASQSVRMSEGGVSIPGNAPPILLRISIQPDFGTAQELKMICPTNAFRGELKTRVKAIRIQIGISGTIERMEGGRFLICYDLEVRWADRLGVTRFSAAGSGWLTDGQATKIATIGKKSVTAIASPLPSSEIVHSKRETSASTQSNPGAGNGGMEVKQDLGE